MSWMRTSRTLVFALSRTRLHRFQSDLECGYMPSVEGPNACLRSIEKKMPNRVGASTQPCLTPFFKSKGAEAVTVELDCCLHVLVEGFDDAVKFRGHPIFGMIWKSPPRLTRLNALVRSMEAM